MRKIEKYLLMHIGIKNYHHLCFHECSIGKGRNIKDLTRKIDM